MAVANAISSSYELDIEDVEYLRHGDLALKARLYKPRGNGPFPAVIEAHGGAWCNGDRTQNTRLDETLARTGVLVAALDFRMPPVAGYPGSIADINYGVRWLKARSQDFGTRPELIGAMGTSSGGHQVVLVGMKPEDRKYASIAMPAGAPQVDASLRFVIACWPVISPLGRYRYAKELKARGPSPFADQVIPSHDKYWGSEAGMADGDPVEILSQGERTKLPPVLYVQGDADTAHPRPYLDRFVEMYRKAGGEVELELLPGSGQFFMRDDPNSANSQRAIAHIVEFAHARSR